MDRSGHLVFGSIREWIQRREVALDVPVHDSQHPFVLVGVVVHLQGMRQQSGFRQMQRAVAALPSVLYRLARQGVPGSWAAKEQVIGRRHTCIMTGRCFPKRCTSFLTVLNSTCAGARQLTFMRRPICPSRSSRACSKQTVKVPRQWLCTTGEKGLGALHQWNHLGHQGLLLVGK